MNKYFFVSCSYCKTTFTSLGIRSQLLRNPKIFLYSSITAKNTKLKSFYRSRVCKCVFRDQLCSNCEVVVGYFVSSPCVYCLKRSNGNRFIFDYVSVDAEIKKEDEFVILFR
ncbi:Protein FAM72B [Dictyocoela muelleri]|nr:Protein FAM72B [Dictyocoela muelleri]